MTFLLRIVLDDRDRPAQALVLDDATGRTYEVLEAGLPAAPGPRIDMTGGAGLAMEAAIVATLRTSTGLHPGQTDVEVHDTLRDALEAADRALAPSGRIPRQDLDHADRKRIDGARRGLYDVRGELGRVGQQSLNTLGRHLEDLRREIARIDRLIFELGSKDLEPRGDEDAYVSVSPNVRLAALGLPTAVLDALEAAEIYTLADALRSTGVEKVLAADNEAVRLVLEATLASGGEAPGWLAAAASDPTQDAGSRLLSVGDGLTPSRVEALNAAGIRTYDSLTRLSRDDLLAIGGIGPKGVKAIREHLKNAGLSLANKIRHAPSRLPTSQGPFGRVIKVLPNGDLFLSAPNGKVYVPPSSAKALPFAAALDMTVGYTTVKPTERSPEASGVYLAVPDVVGLRLEAARELLRRQGMSDQVRLEGGRTPRNTGNSSVVSQSLAPGTKHVPGDAIVLIVGT